MVSHLNHTRAGWVLHGGRGQFTEDRGVNEWSTDGPQATLDLVQGYLTG